MKIPHFLTIAGKLVPLIIGQGGHLITQIVDSSDNVVDMPTNLAYLSRVSSNPGDKIPAIYAQLLETASNSNTPAGNMALFTNAVPAGYIWHIQTISYYYSGTLTGRLYLVNINSGANYYAVTSNVPETNSKWIGLQCSIYLTAGYRLHYNIINSELGKLAIINAIGVTMRVVV